MTDKKSDPQKDPEFRAVVERMLKTPPKPHVQRPDAKVKNRPHAAKRGRKQRTRKVD